MAAKKSSYRHIGKKGKSRENMVPLLSGAGDQVTNGMEEAKIINVFFALVCADDFWVLETKACKIHGKVLSNNNLPSVKENQDGIFDQTESIAVGGNMMRMHDWSMWVHFQVPKKLCQPGEVSADLEKESSLLS